MNDANWLRSKLRLNDEALWHARQHARRHQDFVDDTRSSWDDTAGDHVRSRFLNPHQVTSEQMHEQLSLQQIELGQALEQLDILFRKCLEADAETEKVQHLLAQAEQQVRLCYDRLEVSRLDYSSGQSAISQAESYISQANSCG